MSLNPAIGLTAKSAKNAEQRSRSRGARTGLSALRLHDKRKPCEKKQTKMKTTIKVFTAALLLASAASSLAAVHYVDVNGTNATPPYTNWVTAATNIQDAVDAALAGDEIVVTNGLYATGGRNFNRVKVDKPLSVRSVNGPQFTAISVGGGVRCVYLTNGASLSGFTLTNGFAYEKGGGVRCESADAVVSNCVITQSGGVPGNLHFSSYGGGAYGDTLNNCNLRACFKNPRTRRVRARGLHKTVGNRLPWRPGPLTGRFSKQALRACFKIPCGSVFAEKAGWRGATRELIRQRSATEEQQSQPAFSAETLRAAGLLSAACVDSAITARCGDAPASPPWPQPKSLAAGPHAIFKKNRLLANA